MGKIRNLFKKIGEIKGAFHASMGMIKDRNSKDLTETEVIKEKWQEYIEEEYNDNNNVLMNMITMMVCSFTKS